LIIVNAIRRDNWASSADIIESTLRGGFDRFRGDETVLDWQDDDAVADEPTHDLLGHICIPPLQPDTCIRMKHTADIGMPDPCV